MVECWGATMADSTAVSKDLTLAVGLAELWAGLMAVMKVHQTVVWTDVTMVAQLAL
jgi:hypothetical protein